MEFEDVIASVDRVHMLAPVFRDRGAAERAVTGLRNRVADRFGGVKRWAIDDIPVDRDYDLFFATFHFAPSASYIERLKGLRKRCKKMVCFIVELWSPQIARSAPYLRLLEQFDHVFLFNGSVVREVSARIGRPCEFLPTATDTLRFCPYPELPERSVDLYALGRSSPTAHQQLVQLAERGEIFYLFANVNHAIPDFRAHRVLVANTIKRSRYFFAYKINESRRKVTGGDEALATRYFEGAAAGTIMLGSTPDTRDFTTNFDWPDAVIPVPFEPENLGAILADLDAQPERIAAARRNNVINSLRRHDWAHRWARVLDVAGLSHTAAVRDRLGWLEDRAQLVEAEARAAADAARWPAGYPRTA
jgi:hypothetical protein